MKHESEQSLKEVLSEWLKEYQMKHGNHLSMVRQLWPSLFNPLIQRHTKELRLSKRTLYVVVDSAVVRQEMHLARAQIRMRINEALGEEYVQEVIIR